MEVDQAREGQRICIVDNVVLINFSIILKYKYIDYRLLYDIIAMEKNIL